MRSLAGPAGTFCIVGMVFSFANTAKAEWEYRLSASADSSSLLWDKEMGTTIRAHLQKRRKEDGPNAAFINAPDEKVTFRLNFGASAKLASDHANTDDAGTCAARLFVVVTPSLIQPTVTVKGRGKKVEVKVMLDEATPKVSITTLKGSVVRTGNWVNKGEVCVSMELWAKAESGPTLSGNRHVLQTGTASGGLKDTLVRAKPIDIRGVTAAAWKYSRGPWYDIWLGLSTPKLWGSASATNVAGRKGVANASADASVCHP